MSEFINFQLQIEPKNNSVKKKHRVSALINGQLPNEPNTNSLKKITQIVCSKYLSITK